MVPTERTWGENVLRGAEGKADALGDGVDTLLAQLQAELAALKDLLKSATPSRAGHEIHCAACGRQVPEAPFCQQCGTTRAAVAACHRCGEKLIIPVHLLADSAQSKALHCTNCGAPMAPFRATPESGMAEAQELRP